MSKKSVASAIAAVVAGLGFFSGQLDFSSEKVLIHSASGK
jgi:hypothetical protein